MVKWVEIQGLPPAIMTEATARVVRETIGPALQVDQAEIHRGWPRLGFTVYSSSMIGFLIDRFKDCAIVNHCGTRCPREEDNIEDLETLPQPQAAAAPRIMFQGGI